MVATSAAVFLFGGAVHAQAPAQAQPPAEPPAAQEPAPAGILSNLRMRVYADVGFGNPLQEKLPVGGLQAYLRESVRNRIRDEIRVVSRRGVPEELPEGLVDESYSPLEQAILQERSERYLEGLRTLRPEERLAIIFRLEHRQSFAEIAERLGKPTPDAARMAVSRAMRRLGAAIGAMKRE